jgi:hypothetical protein
VERSFADVSVAKRNATRKPGGSGASSLLMTAVQQADSIFNFAIVNIARQASPALISDPTSGSVLRMDDRSQIKFEYA